MSHLAPEACSIASTKNKCGDGICYAVHFFIVKVHSADERLFQVRVESMCVDLPDAFLLSFVIFILVAQQAQSIQYDD